MKLPNLNELITIFLAVQMFATQLIPMQPERSGKLSLQGIGLDVRVWAASREAISFMTQNGREVNGVAPRHADLPYLVLTRNAELTPAEERTLFVEINGLDIPAPGVDVQLRLTSQHVDLESGEPITVWETSRRIESSEDELSSGVSIQFQTTFSETILSDGKLIPTPTDYFDLELEIQYQDQSMNRSEQRITRQQALLMENQEVVELPQVLEDSPGAAPDEMVVYYADLFPFQTDRFDRNTWLSRTSIPDYVRDELVPALVEAYRMQSLDWGFEWHQAWQGYQPGSAAEKLTVALSDGLTWFHGPAPSLGNAVISLKVAAGSGETGHYSNLTEKLLSVFNHELFHNYQRSLAAHLTGKSNTGGMEGAWDVITEGTAVLAASVGQPETQFSVMAGSHDYLAQAGNFILEDMQRSYTELNAYHASLYWRFLYEQTAGVRSGEENPAQGMEVIRRILEVLYSGQIVDVHASADVVTNLPEVIDLALSNQAYPFHTHAESLKAFARAIYALRLADGRSERLGLPQGDRFYDPERLYPQPEVHTLYYQGEEQTLAGHIGTSFGMQFIEVSIGDAAGRGVQVQFSLPQDTPARFALQLMRLETANASGTLLASEEIESGETFTYNETDSQSGSVESLAVILVRLDSAEERDPVGSYTISVR